MSEWNQFNLQDAMSPIIEEFIFFHDYLLLVLIFITVQVGFVIFGLSGRNFLDANLLANHLLESVWTIGPALLLIFIAVPSLTLLYRLDASFKASLTVKRLGHQWYWSYEYSDFWAGDDVPGAPSLAFDSFIIDDFDIFGWGGFRLLETDNRVILPFLTGIRMLVSRADVLHSWAIPRLGTKIDAMPGRLNQTSLTAYRPGLSYGQCSEICGANHRFMPIRLEFLGLVDFLAWAENEWG